MEQWFWIIIALVTFGIEIITVGTLVSIWFSLGALAAYLAYLAQMNFLTQLFVFVGISILAFLTLRPLVRRYFSTKQQPTNADRLIGRHMIVTEAISEEHWGAVSVQGVRWSVREVNNKAVEVGSTVEIVALEGAKLLVKKVQ